jgi:hypothetical protein
MCRHSHATAQPQARTPVARLQMIPSPASRLRTDLCSPLHGSMAQYDPVKATPLKSLHTSAAPAGAKPRRANGECPEMSVLHDENQAPDDPHVSSPTGLHPIQSQLKVTCVNTCSNRPPLLPVRYMRSICTFCGTFNHLQLQLRFFTYTQHALQQSPQQ